MAKLLLSVDWVLMRMGVYAELYGGERGDACHVSEHVRPGTLLLETTP